MKPDTKTSVCGTCDGHVGCWCVRVAHARGFGGVDGLALVMEACFYGRLLAQSGDRGLRAARSGWIACVLIAK